MFSVKDLHRFAATMSAADFEQQLGPFVLVQKPLSPATRERSRALGVRSTTRLAAVEADPVSLLLQLEHLDVATLPAMPPEGLTVGRLPDCDLVLDAPSVSKTHARLTWDEGFGAVEVEDLGSSNGTLHNGAPIRGVVAVHDGDELSFGEVRFCYLRSRTLHVRLNTGGFRAG